MSRLKAILLAVCVLLPLPAWAAYNLTDSTQFKLKYYNSKIKDENLKPAPAISATDVNPTNNRIQADFVVKF